MKTFYFFNVLGNLNAVSIALFVFFMVVLLFSPLIILETADYGETNKETNARIIKFAKKLILPIIITGLMMVFAPSKKDMYMIYGGGAVLDYINSSEEAKQLPDKTIKVLNTIADKYIEEEEKE